MDEGFVGRVEMEIDAERTRRRDIPADRDCTRARSAGYIDGLYQALQWFNQYSDTKATERAAREKAERERDELAAVAGSVLAIATLAPDEELVTPPSHGTAIAAEGLRQERNAAVAAREKAETELDDARKRWSAAELAIDRVCIREAQFVQRLAEVEAGAAAMREALVEIHAMRLADDGEECHCSLCSQCVARAALALASDAGKGWVSPDDARGHAHHPVMPSSRDAARATCSGISALTEETVQHLAFGEAIEEHQQLAVRMITSGITPVERARLALLRLHLDVLEACRRADANSATCSELEEVVAQQVRDLERTTKGVEGLEAESARLRSRVLELEFDREWTKRRIAEHRAKVVERVYPDWLLSEGGKWLGAARGWAQRRCHNGSDVTWGSNAVLLPHLSIRDVEEVAAYAAAAVMNERGLLVLADLQRDTARIEALEAVVWALLWKADNGWSEADEEDTAERAEDAVDRALSALVGLSGGGR